MNCDEAKTMLAGFADGQLNSFEADAIVAHLEQCGRCRQVVADQERVQHVLDAYQPPEVPEPRWTEIGKRLRDELAGKGQPMVLRTRTRIESLEPTPLVTASLRPDETAPAVARDLPRPEERHKTIAYDMVPSSLRIFKVRPRRVRAPLGWVAHVVGALAAVLLIGLSLVGMAARLAPPLDANTLARQDDVDIMAVEMTAPGYNVALFSGEASDVAAVWVVPAETSG